MVMDPFSMTAKPLGSVSSDSMMASSQAPDVASPAKVSP